MKCLKKVKEIVAVDLQYQINSDYQTGNSHVFNSFKKQSKRRYVESMRLHSNMVNLKAIISRFSWEIKNRKNYS